METAVYIFVLFVCMACIFFLEHKMYSCFSLNTQQQDPWFLYKLANEKRDIFKNLGHQQATKLGIDVAYQLYCTLHFGSYRHPPLTQQVKYYEETHLTKIPMNQFIRLVKLVNICQI